ncbi:MAG: pentapeptide repeat-containing protein [Bacilli bacterium]|nr:pentapeptide repeat-containing protein [Bacilli bacterium]
MLQEPRIKIIKPVLADDLKQGALSDCFKYEEMDGYTFKEEGLQNQKGRIDVRDSHFYKISLPSFESEGTSFINVCFENCDFSNAVFENSTMHRLIFKDCKLVGTNFMTSSIMDVTFDSCFMSYGNFTHSKIRNVCFDSCKIEEASFQDIAFKDVSIKNCSFINTEFAHTSLKNIDFSTSKIEGIKIDINDVAGMQVGIEGALALSRLLKIEIKEDL